MHAILTAIYYMQDDGIWVQIFTFIWRKIIKEIWDLKYESENHHHEGGKDEDPQPSIRLHCEYSFSNVHVGGFGPSIWKAHKFNWELNQREIFTQLGSIQRAFHWEHQRITGTFHSIDIGKRRRRQQNWRIWFNFGSYGSLESRSSRLQYP